MDTELEDTVTGDKGQATKENRFKDDPKYLAMAGQLAAFQKEKQERLDADTKSKSDAEIKKAADEGRWDDAKKLHSDEITSITSNSEKKVLGYKLGMEMVQAGFGNKTFINGAIHDYDAEKFPTTEEYVVSLVADTANAPFLAEQTRNVPPEPGRPGLSAGSTMSKEKIRAMQSSDKKEDRQAVQKYLSDYFTKNGALPDCLKR